MKRNLLVLMQSVFMLWLAGVAAAAPSPWLGPQAPGLAYPAGEEARQFAMISHDLQNRERFNALAKETYRPESLILAGDRDPLDVVLRRTQALLDDLRRKPNAPELGARAAELKQLQTEAAATAVDNAAARRALFDKVCYLRRAIAFSNPLLDFSSLLFIKRHRSVYNHMCDQFYGIAQKPGGGIFELSDPFGKSPALRDVLEGAAVGNGRLKGQPLSGGPRRDWAVSYDGMGHVRSEPTQGGSFLGPDLAFDGKSLAFAYVECQGDPNHVDHVDPARGHWAEGRSYHIFKVNLDGTGLTMLSDGTFNDIDPCFMPSGRLAFVSERRGGYLRCGRVCPTYTLYDMAGVGGDIRCLSHHETNEWQPSVTHDGMIAWTRWDYVDRHGQIAHMPWLTTPDGRDPRAVHGNFSLRYTRPDMEMDIQAIPGSHRYVATAAPHHGQMFGALVIVDPRAGDDDSMGPVRRLTPEVDFPESQKGTESFGTAWPLSDDYFLCAYEPVQVPELWGMGKGDPGAPRVVDAQRVRPAAKKAEAKAAPAAKAVRVKAAARKTKAGKLTPVAKAPAQSAAKAERPVAPVIKQTKGAYGLYLIDSFGNRELIYSDPEIACMNPMPVRARQQPPIVAEMSTRIAEGQPAEATASVLNVYDSLKPWPKGTKIAALRVYQIFPQSVPSAGVHHAIGIQIPQGSDSLNLARAVLGTVPVEADGSANFIVPAGKELYFQVLDEKGVAVQSMRSGTHFQAGEKQTCQGCHEPKHRTPPAPSQAPLGMRRAPSILKPDVDGTNPFSYPRLVQPVLERNCLGCHEKHPEKAPRLDAKLASTNRGPVAGVNPMTTYYQSYLSLAPLYGFYNYAGANFNDEKWYRTTPGQFGARASKLYAMLEKGHHNVKLSGADRHRLEVWLDSCSLFYGVYEPEGGLAQLRGEIVRPTLE